ncbi:hypothetical protein HZC30_07420 [Candidatus Woesearchaeota archaeon]|nr:hypothetical protein [Candidatus Woesearchaeota archaeon]
METKIKDMPKLESPLVRELNEKDEYLVTPEINPEYSWVFEGKEDEVLATEKLDGTDVSIVIENGMITSIWNRTARIPFFCKGKEFIIEGVLEAFQKGYTDLPDGQWFGECIGPKLNGNPYKLEKHLWLPFNTFCREHLAYKSWHKYPKTVENLRGWFFKPIPEGGIFSLYLRRKGIEAPPEGIVFHNLKTGQMAKLRLDMFPEWKGRRHGDGRKEVKSEL